MAVATKFDVSIITTPPNKDRFRNARESPDKHCDIDPKDDIFIGDFESERVNGFWKNWDFQLGNEIERAIRMLEYVENQIEDEKGLANVELANLKCMKRRHKQLRIGIQKFKNSSYALESKKRAMQAGFDYFWSYEKLVVPGFRWLAINVFDVNKNTDSQGKQPFWFSCLSRGKSGVLEFSFSSAANLISCLLLWNI